MLSSVLVRAGDRFLWTEAEKASDWKRDMRTESMAFHKTVAWQCARLNDSEEFGSGSPKTRGHGLATQTATPFRIMLLGFVCFPAPALSTPDSPYLDALQLPITILLFRLAKLLSSY